jgi:flagellar basal body-associated protein FliL
VSYEPPGYLPGNYSPGGPAAPSYNQPPRKNRAGLVIVLMLVLLIAVLGVGGVVTYRVVSNWRSSNPDPGTSAAPPASSPTPQRSNPAPQPTKPATKPPTTKPPTTKAPTTKPATSVSDLAQRFVAQLNANNPTAAAALACEGSKQLIPTLMQTQLRPPTKLTTGKLIGQQITFVYPLSGTTDGKPVSGVLVIHNLGTEPLCVRAFTLTPG